MAAAIGPKIIISKIADEIEREGGVNKFVQLGALSTAAERRDALVRLLHADRLALTDAQFRQKYVNYIRRYWAGKSVM